jgi:hypothetical protein
MNMALSNDLIMQFVKATKDNDKTKKESTAYGTIVEHNGSKYVQLDGAETPTPISSTANVIVGERVTVLIKDHSAIITGNLSSPSARTGDIQDMTDGINDAAKTATNFLGYENATGLQLGNRVNGTWSGFRTQITAVAFNILDSAGTVLASYGAKIIELGRNAADAIIKFCGGKGQIEYDSDDNIFQVAGDKLRLNGSSMASLYTSY